MSTTKTKIGGQVNPISDLLSRAKATLAGSSPEAGSLEDGFSIKTEPAPAPSIEPAPDADWSEGAWVERLDPSTFGCVSFVDADWIHWVATDGGRYASRPSALRLCPSAFRRHP